MKTGLADGERERADPVKKAMSDLLGHATFTITILDTSGDFVRCLTVVDAVFSFSGFLKTLTGAGA